MSSSKIDLSFLENYELDGVANVIQSVGDHEVLLLPVRSQEQQEDLLKKYLSKSFEGLLISPFKSSIVANHKEETIEGIKSLEQGLIEHFYPIKSYPKMVGVTGTNGKTSVAWIISEILRSFGTSALYMGTPGVFINGKKTEDEVLTTTPSFLDIRKLIHKHSSKVDAVVLELSSHALAQKRLGNLKFDSLGWTNFTQDHLDFHKTMDEYFEAKALILEYGKAKRLVVPRDQKDIIQKLTPRTTIIKTTALINDTIPSEFKVGFSKDNLEVAYEMSKAVTSISDDLDLSTITLPPGRFQVIKNEEVTYIVDYAHTPDALDKVLDQVKEVYPGKSILTIFGCGGDRDKGKRPLMGKIASQKSDKVFITSDNPRTEVPEEILKDIAKGVSIDHESIVNRKEAIQKSLPFAKEGYIILVAGKGHEAYQEIMGVRHHFDDSEEIKALL